MRIEKKTIDR